MRQLLCLVIVLVVFADGIKINSADNVYNKLFAIPVDPIKATADGGGITCVGCTLVVSLVEQMGQVHPDGVVYVLDQICSYLPVEMKDTCDTLVATFGPLLLQLLAHGYTADEVCLTFGLCTNNTCRLFHPSKAYDMEKSLPKSFSGVKFVWPWDKLINHEPFEDLDGDFFSMMETLRGYSWRGKDCNDFDSTIYPGRKSSNHPASVDHNCNGIYGVDPQTGKSYEDLFCKDTPQYGYILLGDSAGAHFHIPPSFMTATEINNETYTDLWRILENEFDWPQLSAATAYELNSTWHGAPVGPVDSSYLRIRQRNRCSHRDYQNIGVNGARSGAMADSIIKAMARNQTFDYPVMLTYALIGNDVCNGHYGTSHMTTPQEMYQNVMKALKYLDNALPPTSHVVLMGLADGRILYEAMHDRLHPIGQLNKDVTYSNLYDYLNCLQISPCFGWMNTDEYWRNATTQRAEELSQVLKDIARNTTWKNFDVTYIDNPLQQVVEEWTSQGGEAWQLIEPVDGFHPNQIAEALTVDVIWRNMEKYNPSLLPPINPHNAEIEKIFGDQGGYN